MLWNQVEASERRKDAQLARDIIAALPRELDTEQQIALVREFVKTQFVSQGMIADFAIHDKFASDGGKQPHCHIMLTLRDVSKDGFGKKNREWNDRALVSAWRESWEKITNIHMEAAGRSERLSLRSYKEQGIDKVPGEHMGAQAWNMEQKGQETTKGDKVRAIEHANEVNELVRNYGHVDAPQATGAMLEAMQQEQGRIDTRLMASVRTEDASANSAEDSASAAFRWSHSDPELKGDALSDEQLEAMHWASVRQAVRGILQHSVRAVAERLERLRFYGQAVLDKTQEVVRSLWDRRSTRNQQMTERSSREVAMRARQESGRSIKVKAREDLER